MMSGSLYISAWRRTAMRRTRKNLAGPLYEKLSETPNAGCTDSDSTL